MSDELRISSSPFFKPLCPRVHPCECGRIHESEALFPIPPDGGFNFSTNAGALVDGCPGVKVGKIYLYSSFLSI